MRGARRDRCAHSWQSLPTAGALLVPHCPACGCSVLDALQWQIIATYRERKRTVRWAGKIQAKRRTILALRDQLAIASTAIERAQVAIVETYNLRTQLAAVTRRKGAA
jgi:hypothetical protein